MAIDFSIQFSRRIAEKLLRTLLVQCSVLLDNLFATEMTNGVRASSN